MYGKTNKIPAQLDSLNSKLEALKEQQTFTRAQAVIDEIVALFGVNSAGSWSLINDSRGKIKANASWFELAEGFADRRAAYKLAENNDKNIDFKTFWVQKPSKSIVSWIVALTPNFEDEPYNVNKNVGIDFIIPKKSDRVIIALSNNYIIRTLELDGGLTPTQQNILIKWTQPFDFANKSQLHQILWDSFDLEPVNKEFYKEISSYFVELKQHLAGLDLFDEKHAAYFSSRLIGRLIFCWFIDKKGFINPEMQYFDVSQDSTNYYHNKLEKLFFATLNTPLEERGIKFESVQSNLFSSHERENNLFNIGVDMVTPFLNGGLFEERDTDFVGNKNLTFPTDYFHRLIQTLNHYNFTTDESTSSFQQVAIDPEMLGRIFENLLAEQSEETGEQARKAKGAFYTPREIVDYMCRESLREYLKTKIPYDEMRDSKLELLLDKKSHEYRDQQKNFRQYLKNYKSDIIDALDDLKVLDPACGSGAFPMGMLQLLVQVYERLEPRFDQYETKVSIVKNNIYGVDIEPMAVEISRLRTWLSIIVDEEVDSNKVKPLPNLDFKFVCANSLIPLDQNGAQGLLDDSDLEEKLVEIREKYFNARTHNSKKNLKDKLNKLIGYSSNGKQLSGFKSNRQLQLESYQPFNPENSTEFFDAEFMFGQSEFGIVIANPPYISHDKIKEKNVIQQYDVYEPFADIYCYFIESGLKLLGNDGILTYINSNSFIKAEYGKPLRELLSKHSIVQLINIEDAQIFSAATVNVAIIQVRNSKPLNEDRLLLVNTIPKNLSFESFVKNNKYYFDVKNLNDESWILTDQDSFEVYKKIKNSGSTLEEMGVFIRLGLATGANEVFILNEDQRNKFLNIDNKNRDILVPILKGRNIKRYAYDDPSEYLILSKNGINIPEEYPDIFRYLDAFDEKFKKRGAQGQNWWNLRACKFFDEFKKVKIIWQELSDKASFCISEKELYLLNTAYFLIPPEKFSPYSVLGYLNSRVVQFFIQKIAGTSGMGTTRWINAYVKKIPIPTALIRESEKLDHIVTQIIEAKAKNSQDLEREVDQIIYKMLNLSDKEISIIENETITK